MKSQFKIRGPVGPKPGATSRFKPPLSTYNPSGFLICGGLDFIVAAPMQPVGIFFASLF